MLKNFIVNFLKESNRNGISNVIKILNDNDYNQIDNYINFGTIKQKLYHYLNDTYSIPKCTVCNENFVNWVDSGFKYRETCSSKCSGKLGNVRNNSIKIEHPIFACKEDTYKYLSSGKMKIIESSIKKYNIQLYTNSSKISFTNIFTEKVYCYLNNIDGCPKCLYCSKYTKFDTFSKGYHQFCSIKCSSNSEEKKTAIKHTVNERYGVDNVGEVTRELAFKTMNNRYGCHYSKTKECKEKIKNTCLNKYDKELHFNYIPIKIKIEESIQYKYGTRENMVNLNIKKTLKTKKEKGLIYKWTEKEILDYTLYRSKVTYLSEKEYLENRYIINPNEYVRGMKTYHLDHIYPVMKGFLNGINAESIAHYKNLRVIPYVENLSKSDVTDMTVEDFYNSIK